MRSPSESWRTGFSAISPELERRHQLRAPRAVLAGLELVDLAPAGRTCPPRAGATRAASAGRRRRRSCSRAGRGRGPARARRRARGPRRAQDPGQHLQRRRLARAVRTDERDALARLDRERHAVDRDDLARARRDQRAQRRRRARARARARGTPCAALRARSPAHDSPPTRNPGPETRTPSRKVRKGVRRQTLAPPATRAIDHRERVLRARVRGVRE